MAFAPNAKPSLTNQFAWATTDLTSGQGDVLSKRHSTSAEGVTAIEVELERPVLLFDPAGHQGPLARVPVDVLLDLTAQAIKDKSPPSQALDLAQARIGKDLRIPISQDSQQIPVRQSSRWPSVVRFQIFQTHHLPALKPKLELFDAWPNAPFPAAKGSKT
jgi:hypothetical protein